MFVDPRCNVVNRLGVVFDWLALHRQYFFGNELGFGAGDRITFQGV